MAGVKALRKTQIGWETTGGQAVAASQIWRGPAGLIEDTREVVFVEEEVGYFGPSSRTYTPKLGATVELEATPATYEQLPILFTTSIAVLTTGSTSGGFATYAYTAGTNGATTVSTLTIESGDDSGMEEVEYAYCDSWTLEWKAGEALMMSGTFMGRQATAATYTGSLSPISVEEILSPKLYSDAVTGTIGTTQVTGTLLAYKLEYKSGIVQVGPTDGTTTFNSLEYTPPEITLTMTVEHAHGITQKTYWRAETPRLTEIKHTGSGSKALTLDMATVVTKVTPLAEIDGNDVVDVECNVVYDATANKKFVATVVNALASLP